MCKNQNAFGHCVLSAEKGKTLYNGEIYTKVFVSCENIDEANWTEVDDSAVPVTEDEPTAEDYQTALAELGVEV